MMIDKYINMVTGIGKKLQSVVGDIEFIKYTRGVSDVGIENLRSLRSKLVDTKRKLYDILDFVRV